MNRNKIRVYYCPIFGCVRWDFGFIENSNFNKKTKTKTNKNWYKKLFK